MPYPFDDDMTVTVVRFPGDLGSGEDANLKRLFVELRSAEKVNVLADMTKVAFLDSTALGTLVWGMKNMREAGGDFRMFGLQGFVERLFHMTSLDRAFQIFGGEEDGLNSYRS